MEREGSSFWDGGEYPTAYMRFIVLVFHKDNKGSKVLVQQRREIAAFAEHLVWSPAPDCAAHNSHSSFKRSAAFCSSLQPCGLT